MADLTGQFALALRITVLQLLVIMGPAIALGSLLHYSSLALQRASFRLMNQKLYLILFTWLGTAVHEAGHALFCILFGHRIRKMCLFNFEVESSQRGFVSHTYRPWNPLHAVGNFFIGIGPILLGSGIIGAAAALLLGVNCLTSSQPLSLRYSHPGEPPGQILESLAAIAGHLLDSEQLGRWQFYAFLYLAYCIGSHMTLSPSDLRAASAGSIWVAGALCIINYGALLLCGWLAHWEAAAQHCASFLLAIMLCALVTNVALLLGAMGICGFFSLCRLAGGQKSFQGV